ncbi:MAG: large conductance mechanosensitive channel protein MscL [Clostridia bacterium]|nr:large conductance mechanosensitive channel protein MscL [Clostridia bacterium]
MKKFFQEFKAFISRGNILDMAVGVIIGGAFSAIVTAFTNGIIMPLVNLALSGAGNGLEGALTFLKKVETVDANGDPVVDLAKSIYINWGAFITAVLNFLIIAMTLFIILKVAMESSKLLHKAADDVKPKLTREDRKAMKAAGKNPFKKADREAYLAEKAEKEAAEKAKADAEAAAKAEADRKANPTQEDLLKEIRDLLAKQAK